MGLLGDFGIEFPGRKPLLSVGYGKGTLFLSPSPVRRAHKTGHLKKESLVFWAALLCTLVLLTGPFEQVGAIGERWEGSGAAQLHMDSGKVPAFLGGPVVQ